MAEKIECWRCNTENAATNNNCTGCGAESPGQTPASNKVTPVAGLSSKDSAWESFKSKPSALAKTAYGRKVDVSNGVRVIADRLHRESGVAIGFIYISAGLATLYYFVLLLITLFSDAGDAKWPAIGALLLIILGVWISVCLLVPVYSYMQMRAEEFRYRKN